MRYAPHLDKCMGKNKSNRITATTQNGGGAGRSKAAAGAGPGALPAPPPPGSLSRSSSTSSNQNGSSGGLLLANGSSSPPGANSSKNKGGRPTGRRTNRNQHPQLNTYRFSDHSFTVRVRTENGCKSRTQTDPASLLVCLPAC